jgi:hypothetical protein
MTDLGRNDTDFIFLPTFIIIEIDGIFCLEEVRSFAAIQLIRVVCNARSIAAVCPEHVDPGKSASGNSRQIGMRVDVRESTRRDNPR